MTIITVPKKAPNPSALQVRYLNAEHVKFIEGVRTESGFRAILVVMGEDGKYERIETECDIIKVINALTQGFSRIDLSSRQIKTS